MRLAELIEQILHQLHPFESISSTLLFIGFYIIDFVNEGVNGTDILL